MPPRARVLLPAVLAAISCAATPGCTRSGVQGGGTASLDAAPPLVREPGSITAEGALAIAAIFPTSGRYVASGQLSLVGARLAVEELNAVGGIHGRPLRLAEYGIGSYFVDARHAAALAARDGALAIVGSNSSELSQAVAEEAEANGIVQVTNVSTAADLTWDPQTGKNRPFVFRMCASDAVIGRLLADFARDRLQARRAAVLYEVGRTYSARLADEFIRRFTEAGAGRLVLRAYYLALETDFRPQLRLIKEFRPDVVFMPGSSPDATLMAVQARALELEATFLGADGWASPLLFQRGTPPGDAYYVELCSPASEFERKYGADMAAERTGCRAVLAYDAVRVIAAGLESLGPLADAALAEAGRAQTRRRLRDAVALSEVDGVTGRIRFDPHGDRRKGVALYALEPTEAGPPHALIHDWLGEP